MKTSSVWLCIIAFLVLLSPTYAQETLEQRVERLEREVAELRARLGLVDSISDRPIPQELVGNENIKFGFPSGVGTLLVKRDYVILHNDDNKVPAWVTYHLTRENLQGTARRTNNFRPDTSLASGRRAELVDYRNSGYDRGHMAPAGDFKRSAEAMSESFVLSNMAPQWPTLNRGIWELLESQVRSLCTNHGSIWIFTGPLYLNNGGHRAQPATHIGPNRVAVPTHFFKAILCEHSNGQYELFSFIMQNKGTPPVGQPRDYLVSVDSVETVSGFDFFNLLPDSVEARLEATVAPDWPVP